MVTKTFLALIVVTATFGAAAFAGTGFKGLYLGKVSVSSPPLMQVSDKCDTSVSIQATDTKISVIRDAKKCDTYKLQQKKSDFEFDVRGEKLTYQGQEVGTLKDGNLFASINLADLFTYEVTVNNIGSKTISYSEKIYNPGLGTPELMANVEGDLTLK